MGFLQQTLEEKGAVQEFSNLGDGAYVSGFFSNGNIVVLWDGRNHIDINLFTYVENTLFHQKFIGNFQTLFSSEIVLKDEQPRGFNRVVNFLTDVEPRIKPHWANDVVVKSDE